MIIAVCGFFAIDAQRKVTPVNTSDELKIITKEELKEMRKRAKAEQLYADSLTRDSLRLDSIEKAKKVKRPLFMSVSVGANIWDPFMRALGTDHGGGGVWGMLNLKNRFLPMVELGFGMANSTPDDGNFTYKSNPAFYGKIGVNYNFMYNKDPKYLFYLGFRAGWSAFKYDITNVTVSDGYWGNDRHFEITGQSSHATWGELLLGLQVGLYKNFSMGWSVSYNFMFNLKDNESSRPWYIPGFGTRNTKLNISLSLIYTLPLHKEDDEKAKNVVDGTAIAPTNGNPAATVIPERTERVKDPEQTSTSASPYEGSEQQPLILEPESN